MSIKISEILHNDKLSEYFEQLKKDQENRDRIHNLTTKLLEESSKKLKLQNRGQRVDQRFNDKLKNMKRLTTFIDAKDQIISQNILNNQKLLEQIHTQVDHHHIILEEDQLQKNLNLKSFNNQQRKTQLLLISNQDKMANIKMSLRKLKNDNQMGKQNLSQASTSLQQSLPITCDPKNFNTFFENGLLENKRNQIKLSVSKYYQKYQSKTNEFIRKLKIECMKKYKPQVTQLKNTQTNQSPENTQTTKQYLSLRPSQLGCTNSFNLTPDKKNLKYSEIQLENLKESQSSFSKYSDSKNKTLNTMIDFYQNQELNTQKRFKTPQYRRRIGNSFQQFNKSLTEIESEMNKNSKNNCEIIKQMETIVYDVYDKYKTQQSLYNID